MLEEEQAKKLYKTIVHNDGTVVNIYAIKSSNPKQDFIDFHKYIVDIVYRSVLLKEKKQA